jgi:hypothetical protein
MHDHESPDFGVNHSELAEFESRLQSLTPHGRLDRDRLMFAAGQRAAARRYRTRNRFCGGLAATLAVLLSLVVVAPRKPQSLSVESPAQPTALAEGDVLPTPRRASGVKSASMPGDVFVARSVSTSFDQLQGIERSSNSTLEAVPDVRRNEPPEVVPSPSTSRGLLHRYLDVAT